MLFSPIFLTKLYSVPLNGWHREIRCSITSSSTTFSSSGKLKRKKKAPFQKRNKKKSKRADLERNKKKKSVQTTFRIIDPWFFFFFFSRYFSLQGSCQTKSARSRPVIDHFSQVNDFRYFSSLIPPGRKRKRGRKKKKFFLLTLFDILTFFFPYLKYSGGEKKWALGPEKNFEMRPWVDDPSGHPSPENQENFFRPKKIF